MSDGRVQFTHGYPITVVYLDRGSVRLLLTVVIVNRLVNKPRATIRHNAAFRRKASLLLPNTRAKRAAYGAKERIPKGAAKCKEIRRGSLKSHDRQSNLRVVNRTIVIRLADKLG